MLGLMFIEMESLSDSKQTSGYGVDLQTDLIEERWESREVVVVEEKEEELRAHVVEKKSRESKKKSSKNEFRMEEAMGEGGEVTVKLGSQDMDV